MREESHPVIRQATASDAGLLARLGALTFSETFAADNTPEDMAAYLAASFSPTQQAAELAQALTTFLIAEIDKVAVGYAMLHAAAPPEQAGSEQAVELVRLYVLEKWHGRSVGKSLMQACLDLARGQSYRSLWLGVWERNARARAFYRKWEFEEFGERIFQLGDDSQNDILMARPL